MEIAVAVHHVLQPEERGAVFQDGEGKEQTGKHEADAPDRVLVFEKPRAQCGRESEEHAEDADDEYRAATRDASMDENAGG